MSPEISSAASRLRRASYRKLPAGAAVAIAKEMLEDGARSVQAVSIAVGYADAAFFRGIFKRCTGMTPASCRKNARAPAVSIPTLSPAHRRGQTRA